MTGAVAVGVDLLVLTALPEQAAVSCRMATRAPDLVHLLRIGLGTPRDSPVSSKRPGLLAHVEIGGREQRLNHGGIMFFCKMSPGADKARASAVRSSWYRHLVGADNPLRRNPVSISVNDCGAAALRRPPRR